MSRCPPARYAPRDNRAWQVDRHIPVAMIVAILFQTGVAVWWAATMDGRVRSLEATTSAMQPQNDRMTRLEARFDAISDDLKEIKVLLREPVLPPRTKRAVLRGAVD